MKKIIYFIALILLFACGKIYAQNTSDDPSFRQIEKETIETTSEKDTVYVEQEDGSLIMKIVSKGQFQRPPSMPASENSTKTNDAVDNEQEEGTRKQREIKRVYEFVEKEAQFPGGQDKLLEYLAKNIKYPAEAREKGIQGIVMLRFIVTDKGQVTEVHIRRDIGGGCGEEAKRVIQNSPKWAPGMQKGIAVTSYFDLPIRFTLTKRGRK